MLTEFRATNYRSIREEQTLSMVAAVDKAHRETNCFATDHAAVPHLVRSAIVYGANASGKSNMIWALTEMQNLVIHSTNLTEEQYRERYLPFKLDHRSSKQPTEVEITLLIDGTRYQYGFSYDAQRIHREWLLVYKSSKPQRWFERRYDSEKNEEVWEPFSAYFTGQRETWRKATRPQALFLTTAIQLNCEQLKPIYDWFSRSLIVLHGQSLINRLPTLQRLEDPEYKSKILKLLNAADIHVTDIEVKKRPGQQMQIKFEPGKPVELQTWEGEMPDIDFCHTGEDGMVVRFDSRFESLGTQRLFDYSGPLLDAMEHGKLLVVDEFDTSLHPLLTRYILKLLHNPEISHRAQVWMTTHDTSLLDPELLRRDQVWFVEKNREQATQLYPLTDFSPRKHEALERGYLMGRYGALPYLSEFKF